MPDPPGSTLCTERSFSDLRSRFGLGEVNLRVPSPDERADNPPAGFYTLYERFFYSCFLWLPVPRLVLEYMTSYQIALSHITMRSLRHGIFAVERLSCNDEPFHSNSFVCEPRLNLFVHRSDQVRRAASEYYQVRSREINFGFYPLREIIGQDDDISIDHRMNGYGEGIEDKSSAG